MAGEGKVLLKVEPLHHHVRAPGTEHGQPPRKPDMAHRVNSKVYIIRSDPECLAFRIEGGYPVPVREHCTLRPTGCSSRILKLAQVIKAAVGRPHLCRSLRKRSPFDHALAPATGTDDVACKRVVFPDILNDTGTPRIGNNCACPCINDRMEQLFLAVHDIRGHGNAPNPPDRKIADEVLRELSR